MDGVLECAGDLETSEESFVRVVEQIAGSQKSRFQHYENGQKIVVDAQQDPIVQAPFVRWYA